MPPPRFQFAPLTLATALALSSLGFAALPAYAQEAGAPISISLPAQSLGTALNELARQARLQLMVHPDLVAGKQAPAVSGNLTPRQALDRLLAGSGLEASVNGAEVIVRAAPASSLSPTTLAEVVVTGKAERADGLPEAYAGGQVARGARLGLLGSTDVMDAPFSIASYTSELIENQQARTVGEALARNDASIISIGESDQNFLMRGFAVQSSDISFNGLPGIATEYLSGTEFVERLEVLKGPGAMLSGMSPSGGVGGGINLVTKRAGDKPLTRLTASYAADSLPGLHADIGRRFGETNEWGIRVNGVYRDGDTARDYQREKTALGSLALDYRGSKLRASLDVVRQNIQQKSAYASFALGDLFKAPDPRTNFDQPWSIVENPTTTVAARVEYDFTPDLTGFVAVGQSHAGYVAFQGDVALLNDAGDYSISMADKDFDQKTRSAEVGMRGRFTTGTVSHKWVMSATTMKRELGIGYVPSPTTLLSNIYYPVVYPPLARATDVHKNKASDLDLPSLGVADTMSFLDDKLLLTLGLRYQRIRNTTYDFSTGAFSGEYKASATTPLAGVVFKLRDNVSLYANYIEGLAQGETAPPKAVNAGAVLPPYKSKQYEAGMKFDAGDLGATASLFQITKQSAVLGSDDMFRANGEQRHRGVEFSVFGEVVSTVRVLGGLTLLDAKLRNTGDAGSEGKWPNGVPKVSGSLGVEWDTPFVPGLTLAGSVMHVGSVYANAANTQRVPGWVRTDLGVRYRMTARGTPLTLRAGLENAFNRGYWVANAYGAVLSKPRTWTLSATVDF